MNSYYKAETQTVQKATILPSTVKLFLSLFLTEITRLSFFIFSGVLNFCYICSPKVLQPYLTFLRFEVVNKDNNHHYTASKNNIDTPMLVLQRMKRIANECLNTMKGTAKIGDEWKGCNKDELDEQNNATPGSIHSKIVSDIVSGETDELVDAEQPKIKIEHETIPGRPVPRQSRVPSRLSSASKKITSTPTPTRQAAWVTEDSKGNANGGKCGIPKLSGVGKRSASRPKISRPPQKKDDNTKRAFDTVVNPSVGQLSKKEEETKVSELLRIRNDALKKLAWMQTEFRLIKQHSYRYRRTLQRQLREEEILLQTIENTTLPRNLTNYSSTRSAKKNENSANDLSDTFSFDIIKEKERRDGGKPSSSKKFPERTTPFSKALAAARTVESAAFFLRKQLCLSLMAPLEIEARLEAYERYKELLPKVADIEKSCRKAVHKIMDEEELMSGQHGCDDVSEAMAFVDDDLTKQISPIAKSYKVISEMAEQSVVNRTEMLLLACSEFIVIHWDILQSMSPNEGSRMICNVHELPEEALTTAADIIVENMSHSCTDRNVA